ncbi:MAG: helix-turn-helix transcriptional regulator [Flavobacteriia bacterium]|nr:helix-turn-helix transcriptional regulator [Flavobacteriia bacterium]
MEERSHQISERIRQIRSLNGYSQEYMSDILEVSLRQYQRLENGQREWSLSQLVLVSEAFDVSLSYLIDVSIPLFNSVKKENFMRELNLFLDTVSHKIDELRKRCCEAEEQ